MVRVDQPRQDNVSLQVEHFVGSGGQFARRAHLFDESAPNKKTTIGNLPLMVIHGDNVSVFDE
jgi:hypothetical protein